MAENRLRIPFFGSRGAGTIGVIAITLTGALALGGCGSEVHHDHDHDHDHSHGHVHVAPHGGSLVVLGSEFAHLEWLLDAESGALTIYVLDGEAQSGVRISSPTIDFQFEVGGASASASARGVANSLSGETEGDTSVFAAEIPALVGQERFDVTIPRIIVRGVEFVGVSFSYPEGNEGDHEH